MKVYNLPRSTGKTTRMLYLSEAKAAPILCGTETEKRHLKERAETLGIKIPEPITIDKLRWYTGNTCLIDEALFVLAKLVNYAAGHPVQIEAMTLTTDE